MTLKNSEEQQYNLWWREYNLKLTKWCLERYQGTQDQMYLDWGKIFGEWSRKIKNDYLK